MRFFTKWQIILGAVVVFSLASCSAVKKVTDGTDVDYRSSRKAPSLEVPPDLTKPRYDKTMSVPNVSGSATYSDYTKGAKRRRFTTTARVLPPQQKSRVERRGNKFWLVVNGSADQLWPVIREFWLQQGFVLTLDNPTIGIMETDWAENRARIPKGRIRKFIGKIFDSAYSSGTLDRFRVRLERGSEPNTTEIYLSHKGMKEEVVGGNLSPEGTAWKPRKRDAELEIEMLKRIMVHIGVDQRRAKIMLARRGQIKRGLVTRLNRDAEGSFLIVREGFSRTWRITGLALDRVGFNVEDRDRSKGIYYVRYRDLDAGTKKKGLFSKLKFWKKKRGSGKDRVYQVHLVSADNITRIRIKDAKGQKETSRTGRRILALLRENLK